MQNMDTSVSAFALFSLGDTPMHQLNRWDVTRWFTWAPTLGHFGNNNYEPEVSLDCFEQKKLLWEIATFLLILLMWYSIILLYTHFVVTIVPYFRHGSCEYRHKNILRCECYLQTTSSNVIHSRPISMSLLPLLTNQRLLCLLSHTSGIFLLPASRKLQVNGNVSSEVVGYFKRTG